MKVRSPGAGCRTLLVAVVCTTAGLAGCVPEVLPASGLHPPLTADAPKFYQVPPKKYEMLSAIEVPVTPDMHWEDAGDSTVGFQALKAKAAALGANGILLQTERRRYDMTIGSVFNGTYYLVPFRRQPKAVLATAIFVLKE